MCAYGSEYAYSNAVLSKNNLSKTASCSRPLKSALFLACVLPVTVDVGLCGQPAGTVQRLVAGGQKQRS